MEFAGQECVRRLGARFLRPVRASSSDEKCIDTRNTRQRSKQEVSAQEGIVQSFCDTRRFGAVGIALTLFGWLMALAIPSPQRLAQLSGERISPVRSHPIQTEGEQAPLGTDNATLRIGSRRERSRTARETCGLRCDPKTRFVPK